MQLNLIVATDKNGIIGDSKTNNIPWHLPPDLKNFKQVTMNYPIIMGKNTWLSLGKRKPLPGRKNIIISRNPDELELPFNEFEDLDREVFVFTDLTRAIIFCENWLNSERAFIIGGGKIYENALENYKIEKIYRTLVEIESKGDIYFNLPLDKFTLLTEQENEFQGIKYTFQEFYHTK